MRKVIYLMIGVLLIALGALVPMITIASVLIAPDRFESTARIATASTDSIVVAREMEKIQSRVILGAVVTNLNLNKKWGEKMNVDDLPTELSATILRQQLSLRQAHDTRIISIAVSGEDRFETAIIANEIANVYRTRSSGSDGKPAAEIIDPAQPAFRPLRRDKIIHTAVGFAVGILIFAAGVVCTLLSKKTPMPPKLAT